MPDIQPFHGLRYDLGHVGSLSDVIAPPYDVIDADLQTELYKKHPANVVRLILNREEPGDDESGNKYTRAAQFLSRWQKEGVLFSEPEAAIYVYHQEFEVAGQKHTRRGFMCRTRLERFGEGKIYPHEETHSGPKADRLKLTQACKTNLSQIFGLYPDTENDAQSLLEASVAGETPLEATDHLGVTHRVWPVTDLAVHAKLSAIMGPKPVFIADGHHRYETACNYRDELAAAGDFSPEHPANFVLMMCVSMSDPGMIVLPTHRLFRGMPKMTAAELAEKLGENFTTEVVGQGTKLAEAVWEDIEMQGDQGWLGFHTAEDDSWTLAKLTEAGQRRMAELSPKHCAEWQALGVSILQRLVLETILNYGKLPTPMYVHSIEECVAALDAGDSAGRDATGQLGSGGRFELAALVMPATITDIQAISEHSQRMPAKSTYFYPKLLSGLVLNPLE